MTSIQTWPRRGAKPATHVAGQDSYVPEKWSLLKVIEEIRELLGLKGTSIALLRALLSYVRSDQIHDRQDAAHICFASNAALAERAHVSVQTVERHVAKLVSLGLIARRASGNGKRWARRDGHGQIVMATGLSLMPLVARHAEFAALAEQANTAKREALLLRDKCSAALAILRETVVEQSNVEALTLRARALFRRRVDPVALRELLDEITSLTGGIETDETQNLRDTAPENEGHKEPDSSQKFKKKTSSSIDVSPDQMERAYPKLCAELRFARTQRECDALMHAVAQQLHLGTMWPAMSEMGPALRFMVLGYLLERARTIKSPRAYAWQLMNNLGSGETTWESLLKRPVHLGGQGACPEESS